MPDLPECVQCQPTVQPTPIIIETPPYEPRPPSFAHPVKPIVPYPSRLPRPPIIPKPITPNVHRPIFRHPPRPLVPEIPRPPQFESFEQVLPTPILPDIPQPPELEIFDSELIPQPPVFEPMELESPPEIIIYDIPKPPKLEVFQTELPPQPTVLDVPRPPKFEHFQPELPPKPILEEVPRPPQQEVELPPQPILPEVPRPPQFAPVLPTQPILSENPLTPEFEMIQPVLPELPRPPQIETDLVPPPLLPDVQIYSQFQHLQPEFSSQPLFPNIPLPPRFEQFEPQFPSDVPQYPMIDIFEPELPEITIYESPPVIKPIFPEILNPSFIQIPHLVSPEQEIIVPQYFEPTWPVNVPEQMLYVPEIQSIFESEEAGLTVDKGILHLPTVNEYQDICNDYCLLKRNISECEICLKTGVPADHLELCSNCLVNPSEPDCELCYPILLNLCREFCIFEENEPDCSICYPQPLIELPVIFNEELVNIPAPMLPTSMEYVPIIPQEICPEYCVLTPTAPECDGCVIGVEVIEKVCVDICSGYCLENPNDEQCTICYTAIIPDVNEMIEGTPEELPTLEVINYQCCYGDYCTPMPRNGVCPVVCKELCTTACSNECFNPTCPDCQEVVALNEVRRTQFMIWLKTKLSDMKSRYMTMIEACIRRTELMYERELQAIEMEVDTSFLLA